VTAAAMVLTWYVGRTLLSAAPDTVAEPSLGGVDGFEREGGSMATAGGSSVPAVEPATPTTLLAAAPAGTVPRGEPSAWIVVSMLLGLAALTLLGVAPPHPLDVLLRHAAAQLEVAR